MFLERKETNFFNTPPQITSKSSLKIPLAINLVASVHKNMSFIPSDALLIALGAIKLPGCVYVILGIFGEEIFLNRSAEMQRGMYLYMLAANGGEGELNLYIWTGIAEKQLEKRGRGKRKKKQGRWKSAGRKGLPFPLAGCVEAFCFFFSFSLGWFGSIP